MGPLKVVGRRGKAAVQCSPWDCAAAGEQRDLPAASTAVLGMLEAPHRERGWWKSCIRFCTQKCKLLKCSGRHGESSGGVLAAPRTAVLGAGK